MKKPIKQLGAFTASQVALISVFASLHTLLSLFPFTITIGVSGQITLGLVTAPLIGILLGPLTGGLAVLIGSFVGVSLNPGGAPFWYFTVLPAFLGSLSAGLIKKGRNYLAGSLIAVSLLVFYAHPFGREAYIFPWLHIVAMLIAFSPITKIVSSSFKSNSVNTKLPLAIFVAAFIGVLTDHAVGNAIAMWYFPLVYNIPLTPDIWNVVLFVYPIERIAATTLTFLIVTPIYYSLLKAGLLNMIK